MNLYLLAAGGLAVAILGGHLFLGAKMFYHPMLAADFDPYAKRIMTFVWHFSTVSLVLNALALLGAGMGYGGDGARWLAGFAMAHYLILGLLHLFLGATSGLPRAVTQLFQWIFFLIVAVVAGFGLAFG